MHIVLQVDEEATPITPNRSIDLIALAIAERLRLRECQHGLPYQVTSRDPVPPWGSGATCRPLCDACVMDAVRDVLGRYNRKEPLR